MSKTLLAVAAVVLEAARAVDRLVAARLERHRRGPAALGADRREHLARAAAVAGAAAVAIVGRATTALRLARRAALRAAPGLVHVALLSEELLLALGEDELVPTISADQGFVDVSHDFLPWE